MCMYGVYSWYMFGMQLMWYSMCGCDVYNKNTMGHSRDGGHSTWDDDLHFTLQVTPSLSESWVGGETFHGYKEG